MPPKCKFTKKEIITAALDLTRADGIDAVTARALGEKLGASSRPIFSVFQGMDEVKREVKREAKARYASFVEEGLHVKGMPKFKGVGMQYVRFAATEPKLFQLLFMTEQEKTPSVNDVLPAIEENYEEILRSVEESYGLTREKAEVFYRHLWIYTHGIAVLLATKTCAFTSEEISRMLTEVKDSLLASIHS